MRYIKWTVIVTLLLIVGLFANYTLPSHDVVKIVGTDVKRMDISSSSWFWAKQDAGTNTPTFNRDVRFINTVWPDKEPRVYRNEDTAWNWPPYFKFNSSNITAQADSLEKDPENWVVVKHYGWRIEWFSIFPNVISIKPVDGPDVFIIPWFNIIFLTIVAIIIFMIYRAIKRFKDNRIDPVLEEIAENVEAGTENVQAMAEDAQTGVKAFFKRIFGEKKPPNKA